MTPRTVAAAACAVLVFAASRRAHAEELSDEVRRAADERFSRAVLGEARLDDLDVILRGAQSLRDREPLLVRDLFWRPDEQRTSGLRTAGDDADRTLPGRRLAWLVRRGRDDRGELEGYPMPVADETETYPRITALVLDRVRRERHGPAGLPEGGPLGGADWARPAVEAAREAFRGPTDAMRTPQERDARERRARLTVRNRWLGVAAVVLLLVSGLVAARVLLRRR